MDGRNKSNKYGHDNSVVTALVAVIHANAGMEWP